MVDHWCEQKPLSGFTIHWNSTLMIWMGYLGWKKEWEAWCSKFSKWLWSQLWKHKRCLTLFCSFGKLTTQLYIEMPDYYFTYMLPFQVKTFNDVLQKEVDQNLNRLYDGVFHKVRFAHQIHQKWQWYDISRKHHKRQVTNITSCWSTATSSSTMSRTAWRRWTR